jgi:capsular exopolysaccharide synthesis family protein
LREPDDAPGLVHALKVLRDRWWIVLICGVVSLAAGLVYVEREPKQYTATSSIQFTTNSLPSQVAGVSSNQSLDPEGEKNTNVQLVTATPVAVQVVKTLKLNMTPTELLGEVSASNPKDDYIVDITVVDGNPHQAALIANTFAQQYVVYSQQQNQDQLLNGEQLINQRYARLPAEDTVDRANLRALSQKLLLLQAVQTGNARIVNTATVPTSPSSPKKKSTAIVTLLVGLLLGVGLAFLFNVLDRRIRTLEEFEEIYGLPTLASLPALPRTLHGVSMRDRTLEPFRILLNGLSVLVDDREVRTVLVTSAVPGEGKTTVAQGLAHVAALAGREVILVEADLRRPSFASRMNIDGNAPGLAQVLRGGEDPLKLVQSPVPGLSSLKVLSAGPIRGDAPAALRPENLERVFEQLSSSTDLIVIDSAPLLPVVDTRVLLDQLGADACLVVARAGVTKREEARRARAVLASRRLTATGLVVNALQEVAGGYYYGEDPDGPSSGEREQELSFVGSGTRQH